MSAPTVAPRPPDDLPPAAWASVLWHDIECGAYRADLPVWRALADEHAGPVLDLGAGTGRVALDLAAHGHRVVAGDLEPDLLRALDARAAAASLPVRTVVADARTLVLDDEQPFPLILMPMQTVQLLGGAEGRAAFLRRARALLAPGGLLAIALAEALDVFDLDDEGDWNVLPDMREIDGVVYASCPRAVRDLGAQVALERVRETILPDGTRRVEDDRILLDRLTPQVLEAEGAAAGLRPLPCRHIPPTDEHIGSTVVMLGG